ncbi:OmpH family outer membrane protein [Halovulum dunhuangense]|uniref:OmpH family outer membrane protein n=1 Tax=Halovulum dunhuangense TaxID=1505036 RepID=A0A849L2X6_9RHOB|nr:OmpH family outer membrane protein [Halovulum dunhuangense]NNU80708.1 OmpH family outer membrane protein [Halovulum dunhuangense]
MRRLVATVAVLLALAGGLAAQSLGFDIPREPRPILVLDQDRLYSGSRLGQSLIAANEAETQALRDENAALDRQFEEEERALTAERPSLDPEAFRAKADEFDARVVATRAAQEQKAEALSRRIDRRRAEFFNRVGPVLLELMNQTGAAAVIDQRNVLISRQDLNITDEAIKRLDESYQRQPALDAPTQQE